MYGSSTVFSCCYFMNCVPLGEWDSSINCNLRIFISSFYADGISEVTGLAGNLYPLFQEFFLKEMVEKILTLLMSD